VVELSNLLIAALHSHVSALAVKDTCLALNAGKLMLTYAHVCSRMLTYAHVSALAVKDTCLALIASNRMLTNAEWRVLTYADEC
jgi:hypothetical protein